MLISGLQCNYRWGKSQRCTHAICGCPFAGCSGLLETSQMPSYLQGPDGFNNTMLSVYNHIHCSYKRVQNGVCSAFFLSTQNNITIWCDRSSYSYVPLKRRGKGGKASYYMHALSEPTHLVSIVFKYQNYLHCGP